MKSVFITLAICWSITNSLSLTPSRRSFTKDQYAGCVKVSSSGSCDVCYERKHLTGGKLCGPKQRASDHCLFYERDSSGKSICIQCKAGFAFYSGVKPGQSRCRSKASIDGCLADFLSADNEYCSACSDGYASQLTTNRVIYECRAPIRQPVPHCLWGGVSTRASTTCYRFQEGYSLDSRTGTCFASSVRGCWQTRAGKCQLCDPYLGYSMEADGSCFKTSL